MLNLNTIKEMTLNFTPAIALNRFLYPDTHNRSDLPYFIQEEMREDILVFSKKKIVSQQRDF